MDTRGTIIQLASLSGSGGLFAEAAAKSRSALHGPPPGSRQKSKHVHVAFTAAIRCSSSSPLQLLGTAPGRQPVRCCGLCSPKALKAEGRSKRPSCERPGQQLDSVDYTQHLSIFVHDHVRSLVREESGDCLVAPHLSPVSTEVSSSRSATSRTSAQASTMILQQGPRP